MSLATGTRLGPYESVILHSQDQEFDIWRWDFARTALTRLTFEGYPDLYPAWTSDGRWLACDANDSGRFEIYVRPFPDVNGGRWQVSTGGGTRPLWAPNGQELFYLSPAGALLRVGVEGGPTWAAAKPTMLKRLVPAD